MTRTIVVTLLALTLLPPHARADDIQLDPLEQWGQWRGPLGRGVAPHADPPIEWSESKNIRWKTAIPGTGHSTPIIWGDRLFITSAAPHGGALPAPPERDSGAHDNVQPVRQTRFVVLALNRKTGKILWQTVVRDEQPHEGTHETGSWASNSAVTDGRRLFAHFGSRGLYCLDFNGRIVWEADLGRMQTLHGHGEGSSPALYGDALLVNWDHQGDSFLVALDKRTGNQRWKAAHDEVTSWSSPLVVEHEGQTQVVVAATGRVRGYDLSSGRVIWECGGLARNVVATPVADDGYVYVGNSYDRQAMMAIRLSGAVGDITNTKSVVWKRDSYTPYVPSPLLYGDNLYFFKHYQAFLTCLQAKTGKVLFGPSRLPGIANIFASPVGAAGRVYIVDRNGSTLVIKHGSTLERLALNHLDDSFSASPAMVGTALYLRGGRNLYCIAEAKEQRGKGTKE